MFSGDSRRYDPGFRDLLSEVTWSTYRAYAGKFLEEKTLKLKAARMSVTQPLTKTDYVYRLLKDEIVSGRLAAGHRLRLTEIAASYRTSEMPVREALRRLQQDGLVAFESHRGATVAQLSFDELIEVIATRTYLEILAVCEATPFHDEKTIEALNVLMEKMENSESSVRYSEYNHAFHRNLYAPCPNQFLKREIESLWERAWHRWSKSLFELYPTRRQMATAEHALIVEALREGDVDKVEAAARAHRKQTLEGWRIIAQEATKGRASAAS